MPGWGERYYVKTKHQEGLGPVVTMGYEDPKNTSRSLRVQVIPSIGSTISSFQVGGVEIVDCNLQTLAQKKEVGPGEGIFTLAPFLAGRQRNSRGVYNGTLLDARLVRKPKEWNDKHLVHGTARLREWATDAGSYRSEAPVAFKTWVEFGRDSSSRTYPYHQAYPFNVHLEHEYVLNSRGLTVYATFNNWGFKEAPVGHALHANFKKDASTKILIPADKYLLLDEELLPAAPDPLPVAGKYDLRKLTSVEGLRLDDFLTGIDHSKPVIYDPTTQPFRVRISSSLRYKYCVVFTHMDHSLSLEMQTHSADPLTLFNSGRNDIANVISLPDGGTTGLYTEYRVQHRPEARKIFTELD